jgi:serine/threonine protein kinase
MKRGGPGDERPGSLGLTKANFVDQVCDRFEAAWQVGARPRIEDFLDGVDESLQPDLLRELLAIELDFRGRLGESPEPSEYHARFPETPDLAEAAFGGARRPVSLRLEMTVESLASPVAAGSWPALADYQILDELGHGGMGVVYRAYDRRREMVVALKTMQRGDSADILRFKREFRALADVVHSNLVNLYELACDGGIWFFTMELVQGLDFLTYVRTNPDRGGEETTRESVMASWRADEPDLPDTELSIAALPPREPHRSEPGLSLHQLGRLRGMLRQLAEGVTALHAAGQLHRDLKPSNVLVTPEGRVVILDFGLAAELGPSGTHQSAEGHLLGTPAYMAPEQAAGLPVSPASDWYGVGTILYHALTGRPPFLGPGVAMLIEKQQYEPAPPRQLVPEVPEDLDALCVDLLRRDPEARPTGSEVLRRLGGVSAGPEAAVPAAAPRPAPPLVGRRRHLRVLAEAMADVRRGRTVALFVHGRSGIGKSALVRYFLDGLAARGDAVVLAGRCYEQESVPYKALDSLVDALSRHLRRLPLPEALAVLPRDVGPLAQVFPVLKRAEAVAGAPGRPAAAPNPQETRRRAFAAFRELLARLGDRRPLVLAIDDLQWGDSDSAALLAEILRPPDPPVLLLLGCYRSEDAGAISLLRVLQESIPDADSVVDRRELTVEPLALSEAEDLALELLGADGPGARDRAATVARESEGIPFFIHELVGHLQADAGPVDSPAPPEASILDQVLWMRVRRLPDLARRLIEVVAVSGRPLGQAEACQAAGLEGVERAALAVLRSGRLIRSAGPADAGEIETYHDRVRETVVAHLSPSVVASHHHQLAQVLEGSGRADPEELAVHYLQAGMPRLAAAHFAGAAARAAEALAFDRAARLYRVALELNGEGADERSLRIRLGDALANVGRSVEAAHAYQQAAADADQLQRLELQRRAAYQFLVSGHIDEGLSAFGAILDPVGLSLPRTPRRAFWRLLTSRARLRLRGLKFGERAEAQVPREKLELIDIYRSVAVGISIVDVIRGADYQTRSLLLALDAGEPLRIALALGWEAVHVACEGRPSWRRTERLVAAAGGLAESLGHPHALGMAGLASGAAEFLIGRYRPGLEWLNRAEAIFRNRCTGVIWELDTTRIFCLWSLFYLGRLTELAARCHEMFQEARDRGDRYLEATPGPFVGTIVRLAEDDVAGARHFARQALGRWSHRGFHIQHLNFYYGSLYVDVYAGDVGAAWRRITETEPLLRSSLLLRIQQVRADVLQHAGRCAIAVAAVSVDPRPLLRKAEKSARRLHRQQLPWTGAFAQLMRAGVASVRGDTGRAERLLADAAERFESSDMGLFAAAARRQLGQLRGGDGGRDLIEQADSWMRAQSIVNPSRMASCLAPGFDRA